jgi:DNA-binding CsgD family transcriptional regulator
VTGSSDRLGSDLHLERDARGGVERAVAERGSARDLITEASDGSRGRNWWFVVHVLDVLGEWLWAAGLIAEAVTCLAAADHTRPATELSWDPDRVAARGRMLERGRQLLPPATFDAATRRGEAIELATVLDEGVMVMRAAELRAVSRSEARPGAALSPREIEVLALVAAGQSDAEIADQLFISKKTASSHVAHIKNKLGADSRVGIALAGIRLTQGGWPSPDHGTAGR